MTLAAPTWGRPESCINQLIFSSYAVICLDWSSRSWNVWKVDLNVMYVTQLWPQIHWTYWNIGETTYETQLSTWRKAWSRLQRERVEHVQGAWKNTGYIWTVSMPHVQERNDAMLRIAPALGWRCLTWFSVVFYMAARSSCTRLQSVFICVQMFLELPE